MESEIHQGISTAIIILYTVVVVALIALLPRWSYSKSWGYRPFSIVGGLMVIIVFMMTAGVW